MSSSISDRNIRAFQLRSAGATYKSIAIELGGPSVARVRQIVLATARKITGHLNHPLRNDAIAFIQQREPEYLPSETDGLSKRAKAVVRHFGDLKAVAAAGQTTVLGQKHCGRKTVRELTERLRLYNLDWA